MSIISYYYSSRTVECQGLGGAGQDPGKEMVCEVCIFQSSADRPSALQLLILCSSTDTSGCVPQCVSEAPRENLGGAADSGDRVWGVQRGSVEEHRGSAALEGRTGRAEGMGSEGGQCVS